MTMMTTMNMAMPRWSAGGVLLYVDFFFLSFFIFLSFFFLAFHFVQLRYDFIHIDIYIYPDLT